METEVKIEVTDLEPIRRRLRELGALALGVANEENVYFDRDGELAARNESLRLRKDDQVRLTWKGATDFRDGVVVRPEVEVAVSSFEECQEILTRLGFRARERLEKRRESWRYQGVVVALDTLAIGRFVELEGSADEVRALAGTLGLDPRRGLPRSYRQLWRERQPERSV